MLVRAWKEGIAVFLVEPAYSSKIGEIKYAGKFGLSVHEAAALVLARRFLGYPEWLPKPITLTYHRKAKGEDDQIRVVGERVSVLCVPASPYNRQGQAYPLNPYREPPMEGKGSRGRGRLGPCGSALTGHPAGVSPPGPSRNERCERAGSRGENPRGDPANLGVCRGTAHPAGWHPPGYIT